GRQNQSPWARGGIIDRGYLQQQTEALIERFDIRARGPESTAKSRSGGNVQKGVLAREFTAHADRLPIDQPPRGVDIGAQESIHAEIMRQREAGKAILVISVQLDELIALADRILVMFGGTIMGEIAGDRVNEEEIGMLMAGVVPDSQSKTVGAV